jgi:hypothetical protein
MGAIDYKLRDTRASGWLLGGRTGADAKAARVSIIVRWLLIEKTTVVSV